MEIMKGTKWYQDPNYVNGSYYILFSKELIEYAGFDPKKHKLVVMADEGKHGKFFSIWIVKKKLPKGKED